MSERTLPASPGDCTPTPPLTMFAMLERGEAVLEGTRGEPVLLWEGVAPLLGREGREAWGEWREELWGQAGEWETPSRMESLVLGVWLPGQLPSPSLPPSPM